MKRVSIHVAFSVAALCCAGAAAYNLACLLHASHVERAVAAASRAGTAGASRDVGDDEEDAGQVRLARAIALSKAGALDAAGARYESLIRDEGVDEAGRAALFDLGNLYLREGMADQTSGTTRSIAMIEEAKARYRALLRATPDDWDARYNLELALRLAPETPTASGGPDVQAQRDITEKDPQSKDLP